ncbi:MAG: TRAP transporter small permease subunit, partial [Formivibrio sp.]|nr:TRAP transporter small permease subunit [Formivibrio sp.]MDR3413781.1 TRAP transporter small permease subunit [Formivibrio sp.]
MSLLTLANRLLRGLMVATIGLMAILVFINVVLRYGFNSNLGITEELARYLFVWLTFLGAISAFAKNTHVGVDSILLRMPAVPQRIV